MPQTTSLIKKEKSSSPGLVCGQCGLQIVDQQATACPRCNSSLLPLAGCTGSCFACKKSCSFVKRS